VADQQRQLDQQPLVAAELGEQRRPQLVADVAAERRLDSLSIRRAFEEGLLIEDHSIHIGIRGPIYDQMDLDDDARMGFKIIRAGDLDVMGIDAAVDVVRRRVADVPVYLSIDIDVLDPAFAPGTGTPESGGLTARELLRMLRKMTGLNIVGADVVEVAPAYDHAEITCVAAATVVFDIVSLMVASAKASLPVNGEVAVTAS